MWGREEAGEGGKGCRVCFWTREVASGLGVPSGENKGLGVKLGAACDVMRVGVGFGVNSVGGGWEVGCGRG